MPLKIALADDDELFRNIIRNKIKSYPFLSMVLEANDGRELLEKLENTEVDIVIADYNMPKINRVRVAESIRKNFPGIKRVILTSSRISEYHEEIRKYYQCECFYKEALGALIRYLTIEVMLRNGKKIPEFKIAPLEQEILRLVGERKTNAEIGLILNRSKRTIEGDRKKIALKAGVRNTTYDLLDFAKNFGYE